MSDTKYPQIDYTEREALAKMIESGIRLEAFPGIIADHILRSDWLAAHDAQVRDDERGQWAAWIENWQASVTPKPITVDAIREWLRADRRPFGIARTEPTDSEES